MFGVQSQSNFGDSRPLATGRPGDLNEEVPSLTQTIGGLMKVLVFAAGLVLIAAGAQAQSYGTGSNPNTHITSGYTRSNGTYVAPYVATNPNGTQRDNFGTRGNYNPYNGTYGTRTPRY
jgi:hypothetical protein